ncbi:hypothetical protein LEQ41_10430 [Streptococcus agalactiae]|nr:hypothetical protein [Streptococcus agalactiae]
MMIQRDGSVYENFRKEIGNDEVSSDTRKFIFSFRKLVPCSNPFYFLYRVFLSADSFNIV